MKLPLKVTLQDGTTKSVVATDADLLALEEHFDIDASALQTRQRLIWMAFLVWSALKRSDQTTQPWDEWKVKSFGELDTTEVPSGNA